MDPNLFHEILGYTSAVVIALSLTMRSMLKLRIVNVIGSAGYVTYGLLIDAYPVAALNLIIMIIHLVYLRGYVADTASRIGPSAKRTWGRWVKART